MHLAEDVDELLASSSQRNEAVKPLGWGGNGCWSAVDLILSSGAFCCARPRGSTGSLHADIYCLAIMLRHPTRSRGVKRSSILAQIEAIVERAPMRWSRQRLLFGDRVGCCEKHSAALDPWQHWKHMFFFPLLGLGNNLGLRTLLLLLLPQLLLFDFLGL